MLDEIIKKRLGIFQDLGFPLLIFIARHTKLTVLALKFLSMLIGRTKRVGKLPFAMRGDMCFEIDKYRVRFWVNPIGNSDESRYIFIIETKKVPLNLAYQGLAYA